MSTLTFRVPDQATFKKLVELIDLPEATLEVAETRELVDIYLDTAHQALAAAGSALRLAVVGEHHFLIYLRRFGKKILATTSEFVERLSKDQFAAQLVGDRNHSLYTTVAADATGELIPQLIRRSTYQSKLFRVGETRFEFGLEAVVYEANDQKVPEQLLNLDLIQGDEDIVAAIGQFLTTDYNLELVNDPPLARGMSVVSKR